MRGTMLWFNADKDAGEIEAEDGERLTVLGSGFAGGTRPGPRCSGIPVTFSVAGDDGSRRAEEVALVPDAAGGRARRRHR